MSRASKHIVLALTALAIGTAFVTGEPGPTACNDIPALNCPGTPGPPSR